VSLLPLLQRIVFNTKIALHDKEHTHVEEQRILSYPLIIL